MCVLCCLLLQAEVTCLTQAVAAAEATCNTLREQAIERQAVVCKLQSKIDCLKSKLATAQLKLQESENDLQVAQRNQAELEESNAKVSMLFACWQPWCVLINVLLCCAPESCAEHAGCWQMMWFIKREISA